MYASMRPQDARICDTGVVDQALDLVPRKARDLLTEALSDTRVVTLNGARQAGKSTLARLAAQERPNALVRLLDDPATLRAAQDDPADFVDHGGLLVIDEVQLAPELFRSIKVAVDTDPRPGRFLLTGSAQVLALRLLPDALPGRMEIVELWPFSQGEIDRSPDGFVDAAFARGPALSRTSTLRKRDYLERAVRGGFPRRSADRRAAGQPFSTPTSPVSSNATSEQARPLNGKATSAASWPCWPDVQAAFSSQRRSRASPVFRGPR